MLSECFRICDPVLEYNKSTMDVHAEKENRLRTTLARKTHAFSILNELQQIGAIEGLKCRLSQAFSELASPSPRWCASLSLQVCKTGEEVTAMIIKESKNMAKRCASEVTVIGLTKRMFIIVLPSRVTYHFTGLGFPDLTISSGTTVSQPDEQQRISPRQLTQMADDKAHLTYLGGLTRNFTGAKTNTACVSIDLEMFDQDQSILLEVGLSYTASRRIRLGLPSIESYHWIMENGQNLHNGKFCEGNKNKFNYGTSEVVDLQQLKDRIHAILKNIQETNTHTYLVGHTINGDIKWLEQNGIDIAKYKMQVCDIGKAYRGGISPDRFISMVGMERMMTALHVPFKHLHNGGNDARFNLDVLFVMMEGLIRVDLCVQLVKGLMIVVSDKPSQSCSIIDGKEKDH